MTANAFGSKRAHDFRTAGRFACVLAVVAIAYSFATTLGGCAGKGEARSAVSGGEYREVFQAAREVLRSERFELDRVDAGAGVLTTQPSSAQIRGLEDVADRLQRVVRIEFAPVTNAGTASSGSSSTTAPGSMLVDPSAASVAFRDSIMTIRVIVERVHYPGWRPSPVSVRMGGRHVDPQLVERDLQPTYVTAVREDEAYAAELAAKIARQRTQPIVTPSPSNKQKTAAANAENTAGATTPPADR
ncbi:MAG: hypothetical protein IBJ18_12675 [Phycisphaerales bacterium]|nr:hypothetical protein [Phycisphaerales bacterium]